MKTRTRSRFPAPSAGAAQRLAAAWAIIGVCGIASAGGGVAELQLDRATVTALVAAAVSQPTRVALPGPGELTLRFSPPATVDFREGGVEAALNLDIPEIGWRGEVFVRYVPEVEPLEGIVRLVPETARARSPLPGRLELAPALASLDLPRMLSWQVEAIDRVALEVRAYLQGLEVGEERLTVRLGLSIRPRVPGQLDR